MQPNDRLRGSEEPDNEPPSYPEARNERLSLLVSCSRSRALPCQELRDGSLTGLAGAQPCRCVLLVSLRLLLQRRRPADQLLVAHVPKKYALGGVAGMRLAEVFVWAPQTLATREGGFKDRRNGIPGI